jgi:hypothetical protein
VGDGFDGDVVPDVGELPDGQKSSDVGHSENQQESEKERFHDWENLRGWNYYTKNGIIQISRNFW